MVDCVTSDSVIQVYKQDMVTRMVGKLDTVQDIVNFHSKLYFKLTFETFPHTKYQQYLSSLYRGCNDNGDNNNNSNITCTIIPACKRYCFFHNRSNIVNVTFNKKGVVLIVVGVNKFPPVKPDNISVNNMYLNIIDGIFTIVNNNNIYSLCSTGLVTIYTVPDDNTVNKIRQCLDGYWIHHHLYSTIKLQITDGMVLLISAINFDYDHSNIGLSKYQEICRCQSLLYKTYYVEHQYGTLSILPHNVKRNFEEESWSWPRQFDFKRVTSSNKINKFVNHLDVNQVVNISSFFS